MADKPPSKPSYLSQLVQFYFTPEIRSIGTLMYLAVFGYCAFFYIDNVVLALKFLLYISYGHTALSGTTFLFIGLAFIVSLILPFFLSVYSIFILHKVWDKPTWATYAKWLMTFLIIIGGVLLIIISDKISRVAARQPSMQSFVEDNGLNGQI